MRRLSGKLWWALALGLGWTAMAFAEDMAFENFGDGAQDRWTFIADGVMGGVSDGGAVIARIDGKPGIRLTGTVSTKNNGGFIQVRRLLPDGLPTETKGLELDVRGNGETYYVFIRTAEMTRQWYFYNASFTAENRWQTMPVPLDSFKRSHAHLAEAIDPAEVISIGLFAYGDDYEADLMVREIRLVE